MDEELPWSERVSMLSIHPDAATRYDVARLAAELMEVSSQVAAEIAAKDAEIERLRETMGRALREGVHGPMCDRSRCVCWKAAARAALEAARTANKKDKSEAKLEEGMQARNDQRRDAQGQY